MNEIPDLIDSGALISECQQYRYRLWRIWDDSLPMMAFVMQNPSTADGTDDDPTIRRCMGFALRHGCGGITVRNVFAYRSTDNRKLITVFDAVGPDNDKHIATLAHTAIPPVIVVAWGEPIGGKQFAYRYWRVGVMLAPLKPKCLGINKSGHPKHPLYLPNESPLIPWIVPNEFRDKT